MNDRTLTFSADTAIRLDNLARRLGLPLEQALAQVAGRWMCWIGLRRCWQILRLRSLPGRSAQDDSTPLRLRPAEAVSEEIAVITVHGPCISTVLPHADERFTATVKGLRYRWDGGQWSRVIMKFAEPVSDRAVELGVRILAAGFPVEVRSAELHRRIAVSEYTPETRNWVAARTAGKYAGWFCIQWDREGKDFFRPASLIQGARCYPGSALVPSARYDEAFDFAEVHGFAVSDGALDLAAKAKRERDAMLLVTPVVRDSSLPPVAQNDRTMLSTEVIGICDELADEPF